MDPCAICGIPLDAQPFDESSAAPAPEPDREVVLARFQLPPRYCGVLQVFAQFTDRNAASPAHIETPDIVWSLLSNGHPLHPYGALSLIVNPWGVGCFTTGIRLEDSATIAFVARGVMPKRALAPNQKTHCIAGRIAGRYWYNGAYGGAHA